MSSVRVIAAELDVSPATVSRVINNHPDVDEQTRARVMERINAHGYFPKVGPRLANVVALAYPEDPVRTEYGSFESSLLAGIMRGLGEQHFDLKLISIRRDKDPKETYSQFFLRKGVRGVVLRCFRHTRQTITEISAERFPAVVVSEHFDDPLVNSIRAESYSSSRRAVEHLISLGHRRIALAVHSVSDSDHADRRRAYDDALHCAGIPLDPSLIFELPASLSSGEQVLDAMLSAQPRATAIFATNPMTALGIMRRAQEREIAIPRELSVVGMDDSDIRMHVWPRLTSVCQDAALLGYEAAAWLCQRLARKPARLESLRRTLPTAFEVNGTTAPPEATAADRTAPAIILPAPTPIPENETGRRSSRSKKRTS
ncbi:MAG: LacI family DNA-binding transcriptional regulator [Phycisphaerales bacterium]